MIQITNTQEFEKGYEQAISDIKLELEKLKMAYILKKKNSCSRRNKQYFDFKLYTIRDMEDWIDNIKR